MKIKEESSFLQGVESRLDSLFAEDTASNKDKGAVIPQATAKEPVAKEVAAEIKENIQEIPINKEANIKPEGSSDQAQTQDKSAFISEIEKRFSAIFGDEDKDGSAVTATEKPVTTEKIVAQAAAVEEDKDIDQFSADYSSPMSTILNSPLKDMKSIVLSIEWEISDSILEQFEEEVNKLYLLYTGDRIIQGFLRILRFLGRYIRVRGVSSNQDSINLLLSAYDQLENVMISEGMTEAKKHIILIDNIKKYRSWVENTDIETRSETEELAIEAGEVKSLEIKPSEEPPLVVAPLELATPDVPEVAPLELMPLADISFKDEKVEEKPLAEIAVSEEAPVAQIAVDIVPEEEIAPLKPVEEEKIEDTIKEPDILTHVKTADIIDVPLPTVITPVENAMAAMKDLPPHEAFAYALEELKKTFQGELDALREEIRILKNAR